MVDLEAAVELLPAGRQQLDVCGTDRKSAAASVSHQSRDPESEQEVTQE